MRDDRSSERRGVARRDASRRCNACTHTRLQPVFHVFTLGRVAAGVTCTYAHRQSRAGGWTQNRHGGACRPHKCACVRDEFMLLCLSHVHTDANTRPAVCTYTRVLRVVSLAMLTVWVLRWSISFSFRQRACEKVALSTIRSLEKRYSILCSFRGSSWGILYLGHVTRLS